MPPPSLPRHRRLWLLVLPIMVLGAMVVVLFLERYSSVTTSSLTFGFSYSSGRNNNDSNNDREVFVDKSDDKEGSAKSKEGYSEDDDNNEAEVKKDSEEDNREVTTIRWTGFDNEKTPSDGGSLQQFMRSYWKENILCKAIIIHNARGNNNNTRNDARVQLLDIENMSCQDIFVHGGLGTGNYLTILYGLRLSAKLLGVDVSLHCSDADSTRNNLILPWIMGYFPSAVTSVMASTTSREEKMSSEQPLLPDDIASNNCSNNQSSDDLEESLDNVHGSDELAACRTYNDAPIGLLIDDIQYELRRMALSMVKEGRLILPSNQHPAYYEWIQTQQEKENDEYKNAHTTTTTANHRKNQYQISWSLLFPDETTLTARKAAVAAAAAKTSSDHNDPRKLVDDAVIHVRCGDLMYNGHKSYGFMKFSSLSKFISPDAKSIGIVTQSFKNTNNSGNTTNATTQKQQQEFLTRRQDKGGGSRCRVFVTDFAKFLERQFPYVESINIHHDETMVISYARLILANTTIAGSISSFVAFPTVATFGTGYIRKPTKPILGPYRWIVASAGGPKPYLEDVLDKNLILFEERDILPSWAFSYIWDNMGQPDILLQWFRNEINTTIIQQHIKTIDQNKKRKKKAKKEEEKKQQQQRQHKNPNKHVRKEETQV